MPKLLLHGNDARKTLAIGVQKLAEAIEPTLGPKGMNTIIDRPIGTPVVTRDGVSISEEIELFDRFENMGAQVVREVSMQTNEIAGDGTTTSIVLANALIQLGVDACNKGVKAVDMCEGIEIGVSKVIELLQDVAKPANEKNVINNVANIAATKADLGALVADVFDKVGIDGIVTTDYSVTTETTIEVVEGMSFDRGYLSHHMVTDTETMEAVLKQPYIVMTDKKILVEDDLKAARQIADEDNRPLLIVAEEVSPEVVVSLLGDGAAGKYLIVHPPEYGNWRKDMMEDLAIITGGKVIARDLGGDLKSITRDELGTAEKVITSSSYTTIINGEGNAELITARKAQIQRRADVAPPNIEQDKLRERLSKFTGGTAIIFAGGVTPVEQKRTIQLIEDSMNAVRVAAEHGIVPGGGVALAQISSKFDGVIQEYEGDIAKGVELVKAVLTKPLSRIALNAGAEPNEIVKRVLESKDGQGFDASSSSGHLKECVDMFEAGIVDPLLVTTSAIKNAASVARLILSTETLVGDLAEDEDPTEGYALGGGSENLGRA
jgi:chaperonin GroEL